MNKKEEDGGGGGTAERVDPRRKRESWPWPRIAVVAGVIIITKRDSVSLFLSFRAHVSLSPLPLPSRRFSLSIYKQKINGVPLVRRVRAAGTLPVDLADRAGETEP